MNKRTDLDAFIEQWSYGDPRLPEPNPLRDSLCAPGLAIADHLATVRIRVVRFRVVDALTSEILRIGSLFEATAQKVADRLIKKGTAAVVERVEP